MPPIIVDPGKVREFVDAGSFYHWIALNHAAETEVWIKIHKVGSDLPSITLAQAFEVALCWGWIDAIRKGFDNKSFLQCYTRRGRKSIWSQINVATVARLIDAGRMTAHGLAQVDAAKADGRWDRAYHGAKTMEFPAGLLRAIDAEPQAQAMFAKLNARNRYALAFRLHNMKTESGRKKRIVAFVAMLMRGESICP